MSLGCRRGSGEPGSLGERGWDKSGRLAKHPLPRRVDALKSVRITPTPVHTRTHTDAYTHPGVGAIPVGQRYHGN